MPSDSPAADFLHRPDDLVDETLNYTREEERRIAGNLRDGAPASCPRCDVRLDLRPVPTPPGVSYVRRRIWLVCPDCRRSVVLDRPPDS